MDKLSKKNINDQCPADAPKVPPQIAEKYHDQIDSVWWYAKGREDDPTIGVEINGLRKTFGGYTWKDWWYFMKTVHPAEDEYDLPTCYWYRKKKIPDYRNPQKYQTLEEYIGSTLIDPDTNKPIFIPDELKHPHEKLCH